MIEMLHTDCMEYMATCKDKAFDLAIVDPPYGIGEDGGKTYQKPSRPNLYGKPPKHAIKTWDNRPDESFWKELFRVSKSQIVFGANYFTTSLPPSMGWIFWDKKIGGDYSAGEFIFTSFSCAADMFTLHSFDGTNGGKDRIHPTQKPVALYRWLLKNYAKAGDRILDTHGGSGSSAIACHQMGFDMVWMEKDKDYYDAAVKRFKEQTAQEQLFEYKPQSEQLKIL